MTKKCIISVLFVVALAFVGSSCQSTALHFAVKLELSWNEPSIRF